MFILRFMGVVDRDNKPYGGGIGAWFFGLLFIIMGIIWEEWLGMWMGIGFCIIILIFVNGQKYVENRRKKKKNDFKGL